MKRKTGLIFLVICLMFAGTLSTYAAQELTIEQVRVYAPLIKAYYYGNDEGKDMQATLSGKKIEISSQYDASGDPDGTDYYVLLDTSRSLADAYLPTIRGAVADLQSGMNPQDTLSILTFGDEVKTIVERADSKTELKEILEGYTLTDQNTHLFEAFARVRTLADREEYARRRVITLVFTDGEDCSTNETTKNKAISEMNKLCIPVYAMAVSTTRKGTQNEFVEDFGDFARSTNGEISVFTAENGREVMKNLIDQWNHVKILELEASNNRITGSDQPLTLTVDGGAAAGVNVKTRYHQKDTEIPAAQVEQDGANRLKITFSEVMVGADSRDGYEVLVDSVEQEIASVDYTSRKNKAVLIFVNDLPGGDAVVRFIDITDDSQEENVPEEVSLTIIVEETPEETEETETAEETGKEGIPIWVFGAGAAGIVLILLLLLLLFMKKKKKKDVEKESVEAENLPAETIFCNPDEASDMSMDAPPMPLTPDDASIPNMKKEGELIISMKIKGEGNISRKVRMPIVEKLILGRRSADCDISILDENLSKKHMEIEREGEELYVKDLNSTNGTRLNGVSIKERTKLHRGDMIEIGSQKIQVSWSHQTDRPSGGNE